MQKGLVLGVVGTAAALAAAALICLRPASPASAPRPSQSEPVVRVSLPGTLKLLTPFDGTLFPPESLAPTFTWSSDPAAGDTWLVRVFLDGAAASGPYVVQKREWTPDADTWKTIKASSTSHPATIRVTGVVAGDTNTPLAEGTISISTSRDPVGAPIFYREVILPFIEAVKDPARLRWRFGPIDSPSAPPVVLSNLPVCGNCHSFSADGAVLGMDVDYANDKGSYVLTNTSKEMVLAPEKVLSWSDFKKEDNQPTFGLLSQVSPDGRYAMSTVKDRSVFVPKPDLAFSQLFFPLKGLLAFYDKETHLFAALPGADDPAYVHSNPTWSPDGKYIVFARAKAYDLKYAKDTGAALLSREECREFLTEGKTFRYDLYRIPFNGGKGGKAVPLLGASDNNRSNYFARYSPNGKWIVYCQANSFMLLQPDSELYIIPAEGGVARRLECNTSRMNSWHSFSPNGNWMVFSSKANTPYTQLMLTHMDDQGHTTPPVVLSNLTATDRAANIPEFVHLPPDSIASIRPAFVTDRSYLRTAIENAKLGDRSGAERLYREALALNPNNSDARAFLGGLLTDRGALDEALVHLKRATELNPNNSIAYFNLGNALGKLHRVDEALKAWRRSVELAPRDAIARHNLASILLELGRPAEAAEVLTRAITQKADTGETHNLLGKALSQLKRREEALREWLEALRLQPNLADAHVNLGMAALEANNPTAAISELSQALQIAPDHLSALMSIGVAYMMQGDIARAKQATLQAVNVARATGDKAAETEAVARLRLFGD